MHNEEGTDGEHPRHEYPGVWLELQGVGTYEFTGVIRLRNIEIFSLD